MAKQQTATGGTRAKLAPGSRLPAEVVRASQRERLMIALVETVDRNGLPATTVANLTERAHVSRAAFYEQFQSLEDCFLTTYDTHTARVAAQALAAYETTGPGWPQRIEAAAETLATAARAWPAAARVCLAGILTVGEVARERHERELALVRRMLDHGRRTGEGSPISRQTTIAVTGGLRRVIYKRLAVTDKSSPDAAHELALWLLACSPPAPSSSSRRTAPSANSDATVADAHARASAVQGIGAGSANDGEGSSDGARGQEQRARIVEAVLELAARKGYRSMTHRDIASAAKVSYSTFYNHFANKQEALIAACEVAHERLVGPIGQAMEGTTDWGHAVSAAIAAYLRAAADNPREARLAGSEIFCIGRAGTEAVERHAAYFESLLAPGFELYPGASGAAAQAFAGAVAEVLRNSASLGRTAELPDCAAELSFIALAPFMGAKDAQRVARFRPRYRGAAKPPARERAPAGHGA